MIFYFPMYAYPFILTKGLCFVLVLMSLALCSDKKQDSEQKEKLRGDKQASIVFLGDSLTAGHGLSSSQSPPSLIAAKIQKKGLHYRVINAGLSGDTTADGLARMERYLQKEFKVQHFVIGLGSNDALRGLALKTIEKNLRAAIKKVRALDPSIKIYMWQLYTFPDRDPDYAQNFARIFPRLARLEKVTLLPFPLEGVAAKKEMNQADGIHPNAKGARILAENLWQGLKDHL